MLPFTGSCTIGWTFYLTAGGCGTLMIATLLSWHAGTKTVSYDDWRSSPCRQILYYIYRQAAPFQAEVHRRDAYKNQNYLYKKKNKCYSEGILYFHIIIIYTTKLNLFYSSFFIPFCFNLYIFTFTQIPYYLFFWNI